MKTWTYNHYTSVRGRIINRTKTHKVTTFAWSETPSVSLFPQMIVDNLKTSSPSVPVKATPSPSFGSPQYPYPHTNKQTNFQKCFLQKKKRECIWQRNLENGELIVLGPNHLWSRKRRRRFNWHCILLPLFSPPRHWNLFSFFVVVVDVTLPHQSSWVFWFRSNRYPNRWNQSEALISLGFFQQIFF